MPNFESHTVIATDDISWDRWCPDFDWTAIGLVLEMTQDDFKQTSKYFWKHKVSHLDWDMKRVSLRGNYLSKFGLSSNLSKNLIFHFLQIKQMYVTSVEEEAMVGDVS